MHIKGLPKVREADWMDIAEPYLSVKDPEDNGIYTPEELETILMMAKDYFLKEIRYIKF